MGPGNTIDRTSLPAKRAADTFRFVYKCYAGRMSHHSFYSEEKLLVKILATKTSNRSNMADLLYAYFTFIPGFAPESAESRNISLPPGPAANTMPSDVPNFILRGFRFATATTRRPSNSAGS